MDEGPVSRPFGQWVRMPVFDYSSKPNAVTAA